MKVLILNHSEVRQMLTMQECIGIMENALMILSRGEAEVPLRTGLWLPGRIGGMAMMPGYVSADMNIMGLKVVSVFPGNHDTEYDSHQGAVLIFETRYGRPLAIIDASEITAIRTAAVSAVATKLLARENAGNLALIGSGTQARKHLEAMVAVRSIRRVRVWSLPLEHAQQFAEKESKRHGFAIKVTKDSHAAAQGADIICTVTPAAEPVLMGKSIAAGAHINAIGACFPTARELDTEAVVKSRLFVDRRESTRNEAGDFLIPKKEGVVDDAHIVGEIGDILLGKLEGRKSEQEITLFKSLGLSIEDIAVAHYLYHKALETGKGISVELGGTRREMD